jgi:hypothetical protein
MPCSNLIIHFEFNDLDIKIFVFLAYIKIKIISICFESNPLDLT